MSDGNVLRSAAFASAMFVLGCAAAFTQQDPVPQLILESLSATAYQRAVPRLAALKTGERIQQGVDWKFFTIHQRGQLAGVLAVADGWVGPLSGGFRGGGIEFGHLIGQTGNVLIGEHVFGYLAHGATLVPQYVVVTQATVIARDEYERLEIEKADNLGWTPDPREQAARIHFKDVSVRETRRLRFVDRTNLEGAKSGPLSAADVLRQFTSIERFEAAEQKLESLAPGTDFWDAMAELNVMIVTPDSGRSYSQWFSDGYLGANWAKLTPKGYFEVLRFGYIQDGEEAPKRALIFKNNRVYKLVPHGTREELERYFE